MVEAHVSAPGRHITNLLRGAGARRYAHALSVPGIVSHSLRPVMASDGTGLTSSME
jgi:hypothetical protein